MSAQPQPKTPPQRQLTPEERRELARIQAQINQMEHAERRLTGYPKPKSRGIY